MVDLFGCSIPLQTKDFMELNVLQWSIRGSCLVVAMLTCFVQKKKNESSAIALLINKCSVIG
jgi:hypothetical protein